MSEKAPKVLFFTKPSRTKQSFKNECDINLIMKKYRKIENADYLSRYNAYAGGQFGDFSEVSDYRSALEQVRSAEDVFMRLPAVVRKQFGNDTASFLDFCQNPANAGEMVKMGLAVGKPSTPSTNEVDK